MTKVNKGNPNAVGGKRPGAGRKPGATNKITKANIEKAQAGGAMPLDIMLEQMRRYDAKAKAIAASKHPDAAIIQDLEDKAHERAKDAAPYLHHKLQAMTHKVEPLDLSKLTLEELKVMRELRAKLSPHTP